MNGSVVIQFKELSDFRTGGSDAQNKTGPAGANSLTVQDQIQISDGKGAVCPAQSVSACRMGEYRTGSIPEDRILPLVKGGNKTSHVRHGAHGVDDHSAEFAYAGCIVKYNPFYVLTVFSGRSITRGIQRCRQDFTRDGGLLVMSDRTTAANQSRTGREVRYGRQRRNLLLS